MYNILYYGFCVIAGVNIGIGILYLYDDKRTSEYISSISWNIVKGYHYLKHKMSLKKIKDKHEIELNNLNKKTLEFIGYDCNNNNIFKTKDLTNSYIYDTSFDIMFLKYKNKYKRILSRDELSNDKLSNDLDGFFSVNNTSKALLQVQLEQYNNKIDIHEYLKYFYVDNNIIFDNTFLKWYVYNYYSCNLSDNYTLHIIDENINIFTISKDNCIMFHKKDNSYVYKVEQNII